MILFEQEVLNRRDEELTAVIGYAGGKTTGPDGYLCYDNEAADSQYVDFGHTGMSSAHNCNSVGMNEQVFVGHHEYIHWLAFLAELRLTILVGLACLLVVQLIVASSINWNLRLSILRWASGGLVSGAMLECWFLTCVSTMCVAL